MYITIGETDDQSKFHAWHLGTQNQCTGMTQRDGMGREMGGRFGMGEHMYTRDWFMSMYGKNHHNIVISLQLK